MRVKIGRGPLVAICFFGGTLLPALGFIDFYPMRYSFVADHFQYLASLGLIILGAGAFQALQLIKTVGSKAREFMWLALKAAIILLLAFLTWQQVHIYKDIESLWIDTVEKNPNTWLGHNNLGNHYESKEKYTEAINHYSEALRVKPYEAKTHFNLGNVYTKDNKLDLAILAYKRAILLKPDYAEAYYNLGVALGEKGLHDQANQAMRQGMSIGTKRQKN
jgi:tetratricopeptide (TPR) repeat protein